jgi:diguanylate cyclase (GGDEF)-like protein
MAEIVLATTESQWRAGLRTLLLRDDRRVHEAATGAGLRTVLSRIVPNVVVLDAALVGTSAERLRSEVRLHAPYARIVLLVDAKWNGAEAQPSPSRLLEIVRKPVTPSEIDALVSRLTAPESESRPRLALDAQLAGEGVPVSLRLEQLQRSYRAGLSGRLRELELAISSARRAGTGTPEHREALALAHRLRGTAGSFGLHVVAACAAEIDDELGRLETAGTDTSAGWNSISRALARSATDLGSASIPARPSRSFAPGLNVLVLDDDPDCRQLVSLLGRAASLNVITASCTAEALRIAEQEPIDVALVDVHLGQQDDAVSAIALLRARTRHDLPIAAFSADTSVGNRLAAVHAGADAFLAKPVNGDDLALTVRRLVEAAHDEKYRILVVDDDPTCAAAAVELLSQEGWAAASLTSADHIFETLDSMRPDLLLLDVMMPVNGFDICRIVRSSPAWRELAIVFVTGAAEPETLIQCYEAGGDDCICKPVVPKELKARLSLRLSRARVFRQLAHEDALTGLLTREAFSTSVVRRVAEATRHSRPMSIVMLDLDTFKSVNDQHGHLAGDRVLRALGNLLKRQFRIEDFRGRWGGEEFVMALSDTSIESTTLAVERALEEFRGLVFEGDAGELFCCSFSAGIAQLPADGASLSALMRCADARLYAAKAAGRSQVMSLPPPASVPRSVAREPLNGQSGTYAAPAVALVRERR